MITVVPFKAAHLEYLLKTGLHDKRLQPFITPEHGKTWESLGKYWTALENGLPVGVGGIIEYWKGRCEAFLIFGKPSTQGFVGVFKTVKRFLSMTAHKRIEMVVDVDFEQGHRWAELLGFKKEAACMKGYRLDGGDASLYAMVRG